jgi:hypothetical protein
MPASLIASLRKAHDQDPDQDVSTSLKMVAIFSDGFCGTLQYVCHR